MIDSYMNGTVSEAKFFNNLEQLHEGIMGDKLAKFVINMLEKMGNYFDNIKKYGEKLISALTWLLGKTKSVYNKHPNLIRYIVIALVIISLTLISTAVQASGGEPIQIDADNLNLVIGYATDINLDARIIAMLVDAKDGVVDASPEDWDAAKIQTLFDSLSGDLRNSLNKMKSTEGDGVYTLMQHLEDMGEKIVNFSVKTTKSLDGDYVKKSYSLYQKP